MKNLMLPVLLAFLAISANAQTDVSLKINHKLGVEDFAYGMAASNNLGHPYKTSRLEYYLSQITIVHDGGAETSVPLDVLELVRPGEETATTIPLGNYDVTEIESIKFYIGVYEPVNNEDPTLYPDGHPLAMHDPNMHWGWTAGYKFVAYEGNGGADFSSLFQMHGLGNENYFEVNSDVNVETDGEALIVNVNGNYTEGLRDIDLLSGTISHGATGAAQQVLENWRDHVFGWYTVGVEENTTKNVQWSVFPNPSVGFVTVQFEDQTAVHQVQVINPLGEVLQTTLVNGQEDISLDLGISGIYFVSALNELGETIATERVVVN